MRARYTEAKRARFYRLALPDAESAEGVTTAPQTLTTGPPNPSIYLRNQLLLPSAATS